jgi:DNA-binding NarL/FixJ family response regulator
VALRVLIVDDDAAFRALIRALITNGRVKVVGEAADGDEAVRMVERLSPDIVLMDVSMPRRDGIEATEEIEARWPTVRVVIVTGTDTAATWKRLGAREFIRKGTTDLAGELSLAFTTLSISRRE